MRVSTAIHQDLPSQVSMNDESRLPLKTLYSWATSDRPLTEVKSYEDNRFSIKKTSFKKTTA